MNLASCSPAGNILCEGLCLATGGGCHTDNRQQGASESRPDSEVGPARLGWPLPRAAPAGFTDRPAGQMPGAAASVTGAANLGPESES